MKKYLVLSFSFLLSVVSLKAQVEIVSTGTSAAYTLSVPGVFPLTNGIQVTFKAHTTCSASATMNVTGTGALPIRKEGNTSPLTGGDIKAGQIVTLAYDGTNWQMLSPIGNSATSSVNGTTNRVIKFTSASSGGDSQITDDGTNVGVGTASPGATFEVFQSTNPQMRLKSSSGAGVIFDYNNTAFSLLNYDNTPLYFATGGGSTKMNIQSNGDVGIGTGIFTPSAKLHVIGNALISSLAGPGTVVADASGLLSVVAGSTVTGTGTSNYLARWTSPTQLDIGATFDNGTSVGIGTPTPGKLAGATKYLTLAGTDAGVTNTTASLEIVGNTGATNTMASKVDFLGLDLGNATIPRARVEARSGNGATLAGQLLFYTNSNGSAANLIERMRIRESGEVGIGNVGVVGSLLSIGASNQFQVSSAGNLSRINNVTYTWPAANGTGFLSNDGAGILSWSTAGVLAGGTTNYVPKWSSANSLSSTSLIFDNGTTVGINTAAPSAASKLHVVGSGNGSTLNVEDNALTNGSALYLSSTSTTGTASNNSRMITIARSGANASASHTAYGLQSNVTTTGTTSTNVAGFFSASGATNNYAIIVPSTGGRVGIGTTTPTHSLTLTSSAGGATLQSINSFNTSGFASSLAFQKARGTEAAPAAVASGDDLGYMDFYGYNSGNASMQLGATISATAAQAFSTANAAGSNLVFSTAPLSTVGVVERMTVYYNGAVGIGATGIPTTSLLEVLGDVEIPAANDYSYTTAKTNYMSISAASFSSDGSATYYTAKTGSTSNFCYINGGTLGSIGYSSVGINLPHGAVITGITAHIYDNDATYDSRIQLYRLAPGTATAVANTALTTGASTTTQVLTTGAIAVTIDNQNNYYQLTWDSRQGLGNTMRLYGIFITYTVLKAD